jgi:hypothetical protein
MIMRLTHPCAGQSSPYHASAFDKYGDDESVPLSCEERVVAAGGEEKRYKLVNE